MFTWLNKAAVRSSDGFEFRFTGRFTAEYEEGGRTLELFVEGDGRGDVTIYEGSIEPWLRQIENPFARRTEQHRLLNNIREAVEFQDLRLHVLSGREPGEHSLR
jgi:hypothetical protein